MAKTRGIRFKDNEEKMVQDFLKQNPFFDFSSMARLAITKFIEAPELTVKPVKPEKSVRKNKTAKEASL